MAPSTQGNQHPFTLSTRPFAILFSFLFPFSDHPSTNLAARRTRGRKAASVPGRVLDTVLMMVQLTLAYLLMLIAMVYNTGLFIAVIAGCGAGHFLYGKCDYESGSCH
eukprot:m.311994 g.311994  ORF g.311994 m.311994 type:complete len:108 (+) comp55380_c0_seq1:842-1165(+)